jgi:hypothetical protein
VSEERLIPVRDFGEIRAGMVLVLICQRCESRHRAMAVHFFEAAFDLDMNETTQVWSCLPPGNCCPVGFTVAASPRGVREERVFRVDDGMTLENRVADVVTRRKGVRSGA